MVLGRVIFPNTKKKREKILQRFRLDELKASSHIGGLTYPYMPYMEPPPPET